MRVKFRSSRWPLLLLIKFWAFSSAKATEALLQSESKAFFREAPAIPAVDSLRRRTGTPLLRTEFTANKTFCKVLPSKQMLILSNCGLGGNDPTSNISKRVTSRERPIHNPLESQRFDNEYRYSVHKWWVENELGGNTYFDVVTTRPFALPRAAAGVDFTAAYVVPPVLFQYWVAKRLCDMRRNGTGNSPFEQLRLMVRYNPPQNPGLFSVLNDPRLNGRGVPNRLRIFYYRALLEMLNPQDMTRGEALLVQTYFDDTDVQFRNVVDELDIRLQQAFGAQVSTIGDDWWNFAEYQYERAQCNLARWLERKHSPFSQRHRDVSNITFPPNFLSPL